MSEGKEIIEEFDCFISTESCSKYQLINCEDVDIHNATVNNASYKHKIPSMKLNLSYDIYGGYRKKNFNDAETQVVSHVEESMYKNNFIVYFLKGEAHFMPLIRPVVRLCNDSNTTEKSFIVPKKRTSMQSQNSTLICKKSLDEFNPNEKEFIDISVNEEIRQPWLEAMFHKHDELSSKDKRGSLLCFQKDDLLNFQHSASTVPQQLVGLKRRPRESLEDRENIHSIESELLKIMLQNEVISFSTLRQQLVSGKSIPQEMISEKNVLKHLPRIAILIRGLWVLKSEVLYKFCQPENVSADLMKLARDYALCVFYKGRNITSKNIQSVTSLPAVETEEMLQKLDKRSNVWYRKGVREWRFPEHDFSFIKCHYEINQSQLALMNRKVTEIEQMCKVDLSSGDYTSGARKRCRDRAISCSAVVQPKQMRFESPVRNNSTKSVESSSRKRRRTNSEPGSSNTNETTISSSQSDVPIEGFTLSSDMENYTIADDVLIDTDSINTISNIEVNTNSQKHDDDKNGFISSPNREILDTDSANKDSDLTVAVSVLVGAPIKEETSLAQEHICEFEMDTSDLIKDEPFVDDDIKSEKEYDHLELDDEGRNELQTKRRKRASLQENDDSVENQSTTKRASTKELDSVNEQDDSTNFIYKHVKDFIEVQKSKDILPIFNLSILFLDEYLNEVSDENLDAWVNLSREEKVTKIERCIENSLVEIANKISICWPNIRQSMPQQTIYIMHTSEVEEDIYLLNKIVLLLQQKPSFQYMDIKKAITADKDMIGLRRLTRPQLIEKLKKYCHAINKQWYLKCTVGSS